MHPLQSDPKDHMDLLLFSNSTNHGMGYLEHALAQARDFLGEEVLFVPYALADHDAYTRTVANALGPDTAVTGLHTAADPRAAIEASSALFIGGGNTFRLLRWLQDLDLLDVLRTRTASGMRYMGASAGTNVAGPSIRTTNDMPISQPHSFESLGLVPVQINPHYLDADPTSTHQGETREQRLTEFLEENDALVLGLREGTWLRVQGDTATIEGKAVTPGRPPAILFERGSAPRDIAGDVSWLLHTTPTFATGLPGVAGH